MVTDKAFQFRPAAVLRFSGEDHLDFLHGQGTADLRGGNGYCRYSLWLDHRGIIQGDAFVLKESDESVLLVSYATPADKLMEKFDRHIIADDVEIENLTATFELVSLQVEDSDTLLINQGIELPPAGKFLSTEWGIYFHGRRLGSGSIDLLTGSPREIPFKGDWIDTVKAEQIRIAAGFPLVPLDTASKGLNPLEANILSALSFDKGCYLGQEVVARVHRLDRLTRRLVRISGDLCGNPPPGDLSIDGTVVGHITSVVEFPDKWMGLAWLKARIEDGIHPFAEGLMSVQSVQPS